MNLTELLSTEEWFRLEQKINDRFGLNTCIYNPDGYRITEPHNWPNRLCPAVKANSKGQSFICAVAHMNVAILAQQSRRPLIEVCDAGLMKAVVPIFWNDDFLGSAASCGFLLDGEEVDTFLISKITGIDEGEIAALSENVGRISMRRAEELNGYIHRQIQENVAPALPLGQAVEKLESG